MGKSLKCCICNQINLSGIYLRNQYICCCCEEEIIKAAQEHAKYEIYKEKIKEIVFK
jgi:hypothetical protein